MFNEIVRKSFKFTVLEKKLIFYVSRLGYVFGSGMNKKRLVKKLLYTYKKKEKIKIFNKNLTNLIHKNDLSNIIINTFQTAKGIYNLTDLNEITLNHSAIC